MTGARDGVQVFESEAALRGIEREWTRLWQMAPGATPFQSPAWLLPWWTAFGDGRLLLVTVWRSGALAALLPLFVVRRDATGPREVLLLGTGNSDYLDVLAWPGCAATCADAAIAVLGARADWDVCDLQSLPPASPLLARPVPRAWHDVRLDEAPCPALAPVEVRPAFARRLRYERRRLERLGEVTVRQATGRSLAGDLDTLFALHGARWRARGDEGVLADARTRAFHAVAAAAMLRAGVLRLLMLEIDGAPAAAYYGFRQGSRAFYYLGGFDPAYESRSVGSLVVAEAIAEAARGGADVFDFLSGREDYKYRWGASDRPRARRRFGPARGDA